MEVGVELLAPRRVGLDALAGQGGVDLRADQPQPLGVELVGLQRAVEVVDRGQQLLGQPRHALGLGRAEVLGHALAVVLEVRLRALGQRQVLVALARLLAQGRDVLLERGRLGLALIGRGRLVPTRLRVVGMLAHPLLALLFEAGVGRLILVRRGVRSLAGHDLPSSTTSASTTSSSSSSEAASPDPFGAVPSAPVAACSAWAFSYIACETAWKAVWSSSTLARISAASSDSSFSRTSLARASMRDLESASIESPSSVSWRSAW